MKNNSIESFQKSWYVIWVWFLRGLFRTKATLGNSSDSIQTITGEDKGVHSFPWGINPNVKVITLLEIELAYVDAAVKHVNRYTTKYSPDILQEKWQRIKLWRGVSIRKMKIIF